MGSDEALKAANQIMEKLISVLGSKEMVEVAKLAQDRLLKNGVAMHVSLDLFFGGRLNSDSIGTIHANGSQEYEDGEIGTQMFFAPTFTSSGEDDGEEDQQKVPMKP